MVLCMFASCNSNNRINRGLKFFRVPYSKQPGVAKLWFSRSKRADLSFKDLVASSHYVVCEKHFSPSQLEPYSFGDERRCRVREGELPIPDKQQIVTTIMRAQQSRKKSRNEAAVMVCEDYPGYTGMTFVYNRITQHMIVQWTGLEVDTQTKTDTEQSLLSLFKAGTAESHLKVVNVRSGGDVCISKENVEMGDINVLQAKVKDEPTDILVDISSFGGPADAPPLDMSDDGATTHLRMERVVTDVTVDTVSRVSADRTYVTDESARAKKGVMFLYHHITQPGYTSVMFLYHHITQHVIVQWTGLEVDTQTKTDTEQSLLSLFKATAESHLKVVNVRSGGDVCISKENVEMGDINVLQARVKDEPSDYKPTDILVDKSSLGGPADAPPLDMSDDDTTTHLRMESVATDVTVDAVPRMSADHTYVRDESARAKQATAAKSHVKVVKVKNGGEFCITEEKVESGATAADSLLKVVNIRSGCDVCISKEKAELRDILADKSPLGGPGDAPPLDMSDDGTTTHLRMERVATAADVRVDVIASAMTDHAYVTDGPARAKQGIKVIWSKKRRKCVVGGCTETDNGFSFPKDLNIRAKWEQFVKLTNSEFKSADTMSRICLRHFHPQDVSNYGMYKAKLASHLKLNKDAVPSIYPDLPSNETSPSTAVTSAAKPATAERTNWADDPKDLDWMMEDTTTDESDDDISTDSSDDDADEDYKPADYSHHCAACGKCFVSKSLLTKHKKTHQKTRKKSHQCKVCQETFASPHLLRDHQLIHPREKPYQCDVCGNQYTTSSTLSYHKATHQEVKRYQCKVCEKRFSYASVLKCHMMTHTGVKRYKCTVCGKRFIQSGQMKAHMQIHTGEKSHACSVCKKRFIKKIHLDRHVRIHTGDKPYECTICSRRFNQCGNLKTHMKTHRKDAPKIVD